MFKNKSILIALIASGFGCKTASESQLAGKEDWDATKETMEERVENIFVAMIPEVDRRSSVEKQEITPGKKWRASFKDVSFIEESDLPATATAVNEVNFKISGNSIVEASTTVLNQRRSPIIDVQVGGVILPGDREPTKYTKNCELVKKRIVGYMTNFPGTYPTESPVNGSWKAKTKLTKTDTDEPGCSYNYTYKEKGKALEALATIRVLATIKRDYIVKIWKVEFKETTHPSRQP